MKSAFECFQHAAKCEEQAQQATSDAGRASLLETAKHWRALGAQAKAKDGNKPRGPLAAEAANSPVRPQAERLRARRAGKLRDSR
jgi:hypothetical protein